MQMDEGMDTGDILHQKAITPTEQETSGSLFHKMAILGGEALLEAIVLIKKGNLTPVRQNNDEASHAPMLKKEDGLINWNTAATEIHCRIRGLDPWPSAFCFLNGKRFRLFSPEVIYQKTVGAPGTVIHADKRGLLINTGENCINIREIQPEGKKRMSVQAYTNGHPIPAGTDLSL